jgi:hypothetical protein
MQDAVLWLIVQDRMEDLALSYQENHVGPSKPRVVVLQMARGSPSNGQPSCAVVRKAAHTNRRNIVSILIT